MSSLAGIIFYAFAFLLAIAMHEYAHGAAADAMGDPTPRWSGRLTLNPLAHLDLIGTMVFLISLQTGIGFGWAKPVPINPHYFRDSRRGLIVTGLAGPVANLILAVLFVLPLHLFPREILGPIWTRFLTLNVLINTGLGMFNLLPIPPLDGSKVLEGLLPFRYTYQLAKLETYGPFFLLLLLMTGLLDYVLTPMASWFLHLLGAGIFW